jgi:hypothetical protein
MSPLSPSPSGRVGTTLYLSSAALALFGIAGRIRAVTPAIQTVRIVAREYQYEVPARVPAGLVRLELINAGKELHHAQLLRLEQGRTVADLAALDLEAGPPSWVVPVGGPNAVEPGDSARAIETLVPGNYALICFIPDADGKPHVMKGMAAGFQAGPAQSQSAARPKVDATIRLADYGFAPSAALRAGARTINVVNDAHQPHELVLVRLNEGKSAADLVAWSAAHMAGPAPGHFVGGIVGLAPGGSSVMETTLEPGNYALICYLPDAKDGMPHFAHGMVAPLAVGPAS